MANALQMAGAAAEPSNFAPLHTNRIFTGLWTNRSPLRDAATNDYQEHFGLGRQDSILGGYNSEISSKLTLRRRFGTSVYNNNGLPSPILRFYSFNTFTLTDEVIRVMCDTATTVYDNTAGDPAFPLWTKSANAGKTFFLGIGNTLYFTNGIDNKQATYDPVSNSWGPVSNWGITAPTTAPTVSQQAKPNPYPPWQASTAYSTPLPHSLGIWSPMTGTGFGQLLNVTTFGTTGASEPAWPPFTDGSVTWTELGQGIWYANNTLPPVTEAVIGKVNGVQHLFYMVQEGTTGASEPAWVGGYGALTPDGSVTWQDYGPLLQWSDIGANTKILNSPTIVDPNGYLQTIAEPGKTGATPPTTWATEPGAFTTDGGVTWINQGPFSVAGTAPTQYGYAYKNSATGDISNMSPPSLQITIAKGGQVVIQGQGSADPQVDTIVLYRTAQGGSTFLYLDEIPNPGGGKTWTYNDSKPDSELNTEIQAQVGGEGTPLPAGATCLGYHLTRIFAAVGNVVYVSSGPDAVASTSSGNAGFDTTFTAQSRITRFWTCSLGMVVFTVRDAYIILGSATDADPLYMVTFIEELPLKSYDCFTVNKTTPYMLMGNNMLVALDPSAGITEVGFPIADRLTSEFDATKSFVTYHSRNSEDTALYVANGNGYWYRMAAVTAPETGSSWSTRANIPNMGCVQSVEVSPGEFRLLFGSASGQSPIHQRDRTVNTDVGTPYPVDTLFGSIVLAQPGQLAALHFITLESVRVGTRAGVALLLGEISGTFDPLSRTRQDPTNLPPSNTLYSDRYHFAQNQKEAWCRHFQMDISWPAEDAPNELLTFTVFGQTWQEMRSQ